MRLLVTGGTGYIGSVVAAMAASEGHEVVVLDDLSTGHADAVPAGCEFVRGTIRETAGALLADDGVDAVLHFAAKSLVGESVAHPARYWEHNLGGSLALLEAMREHGTKKIIFSSTAAVYGNPERTPIEESDPARPTNPYGESKLAVDTALTEYARMHGIGAVSLRYFNVAGAHQGPDGRWLGENHQPETHLIPNILAAMLGPEDSRASFTLFGVDYPTPDGTCVRDYIHVTDLAKAHLVALGACEPGKHQIYNLGTGTGSSNREVLTVCQEVTGRTIQVVSAPRRPGDSVVLVASAKKIFAELGWQAERGLAEMVADAWAFAQQRENAGQAAR